MGRGRRRLCNFPELTAGLLEIFFPVEGIGQIIMSGDRSTVGQECFPVVDVRRRIILFTELTVSFPDIFPVRLGESRRCHNQ